MRKKIKSLLILSVAGVLSLASAFADDAKIPCLKKNGGIGLNSLSAFDCNLTKAVSNDPKVKNAFEDKVNDKLADKLATKASQRLEEIVIMDRYFDQIGLDLGMDSKDVERKCRLDVIASPKCGGGSDEKLYASKLAHLLNKFPTASLGKGQKDNLLERMRAKMGELRGAKQKKVNSCPASGTTGHFFLDSQFSQSAAVDFISSLQATGGTAIAAKFRIEKFYETYPQFKMLKDAESLGPEGAALLKKFEQQMKSYQAKDGSQKIFIDKFFDSKDTQQQFAKVLANKCETIAKNIEEYLCNDLDHLAMNDEFASEFFKGDGEETEVNRTIAKGFSCGLKNAEGEDEGNNAVFTKGETVASWDEKFLEDTRAIPTNNDIAIIVDNFCRLYDCSNPQVKGFNSCKNGGPLKSEDLLKLCQKSDDITSCDQQIQKQITFLKSLEKDEEVVKYAKGSSESYLNGDTTKAKGFSSFYQNFVGVEGTLLAEGKKVTPITVAEKTAEFVEKKIDPGVASLSSSAQLAQNKMAMKQETQGDMVNNQVMRNDERFNSFVSSNPNSANEDFRRSLVHNNMKGGGDAVSSKTKKSDVSAAESDRTEEMKKLRAELAEAINSVKGTDEEKLSTIADNNRMVLAPKGSSAEVARPVNLSQAEQNRLDQYRDNLNAWESKLRGWQNQLTDREISRGAGSSGSSANAADPRRNTASDDFGSNSASNDYGASAVAGRLSKSSAGGSGAVANGKGEAEVARAPGAEGVEGEQSVVNSENLATLRKESLKSLGIVPADSFIIKVRHQDKIYDIPVKTFSYNGKSMFVPLLNERNKDLARIVYNSPLFNDYRQYQAEKDRQR
ncbi:hypothetical protein DOM21_10790 [Bacteriovorax stolpii]|uniref:Uncharacterized protein n=1 Tax=Bacteriovorax stolpii TaxID=960 RepID=A0A2K9NRG1_BACTC|nr:hypothetical protein [Bacteriovorax stolpii]AUN98097.1 hypothetical protein C0V70_08235 [Bacteriovorax stolpii]QDK41923.1 hypothetical protein DOM21_10790 [Bacteriovorax stolpii]TDP52011.1 hypothetical protein C8D79_2657 [Bacteriovorax stolpii]